MGMQFDQWLEEELKRGFRYAGSRPLPVPRYASLPHLPGRSPIVHAIATAARSKVAIAATALTLAAGGTVGAKAAVTGNPNPFNWGQQVKQKVVTCKQDLKPGEHGIGQCVSKFAKQHGIQERQAHSKAGSHEPRETPKPSKTHGKQHGKQAPGGPRTSNRSVRP